MYIHERKDWPRFHWSRERSPSLSPLSVTGRAGSLGTWKPSDLTSSRRPSFETLTEDVLKSSEIEGEKLDAEQVRSSIARRLGMDIGALKPADRNVEGVVEMMLDATRHYDQPLTDERLFAWHASLFPTGRSGMTKIRAGAWRDDSTGPMQVVSGAIGKENVHFEAPEAKRLDVDMRTFLDWFNTSADIDQVLIESRRRCRKQSRHGRQGYHCRDGYRPWNSRLGQQGRDLRDDRSEAVDNGLLRHQTAGQSSSFSAQAADRELEGRRLFADSDLRGYRHVRGQQAERRKPLTTASDWPVAEIKRERAVAG